MTEPDLFMTHRPYLFGLAYRMLGSASDAEDVLQDAFLRHAAAPRDDLRAPKAYFTTVVTRLCLDRLKAARATREQYIGPWLPEPVLTGGTHADPHAIAEQHESITLAFLVMLETLTPQERAVFLLREVFEYPYESIAPMLDASPATCRQWFHRAKIQIAAHQPRFAASPTQQQQLVQRFLGAVERGDVTGLQQLLAHDVRLWADSGGKSPAPRRPVAGRDAVAKVFPIFFANTMQALGGDHSAFRTSITTINSEPAALMWLRDQLDSALICSISDAQITTLRLIRNPDKLGYLQQQLRAEQE